MDKQRFLELLDNPHQINAEDTKALSELKGRFPFFHTNYLLLTKGLKLHQEQQYQEQLPHSAAHIVNREVLYELVMKQAVRERIAEVETIVAQVSQEDLVQGESSVQTVELPDTNTNDGVEDLSNDSVAVLGQSPADSMGTERNAEKELKFDNYDDSEVEDQNVVDTEETAGSLQRLEGEILKEAIKASIEQEVSMDDTPEIDLEHPINGESSYEEKVREEGDEAKLEQDDVDPVNIVEPKKFENQSQSTTRTLVGWLRSNARDAKECEITVVKEQEETSQIRIIEGEAQSEMADLKENSVSDLVDRFIENEPSITRKSEFFSPSNVARMSVVDSGEFVTETLAKIYANQGNYAKAIKTYKTLILKNPEKKVFFAGRIRFLRKKIEK